MTTYHLTNETEINKVLAEKKVAIVDFTATWCPPCKMIGPVAEKLAQSKGVTLIKVDVDQAGELSGKFSVSGIPTFILFQGSLSNPHSNKFSGADKDKLEEMFSVAASLL